MNKKLKIVSSLALAGMIVTSSIGVNKVFADSTSDYITNPVGIYNKLVEGKSVVPFVLANSDDKLTVKDVTGSDLFNGKVRTINGTAVADQNELVGTGDVIKTTDGKEYTVVLYGDVNGDGSANANDALQILKYATQSESVISSDVQKLAADISGLEDENGVRKLDGKINSLDAQAINKFVAKLDKDLIEDLPAPEEEEVIDSNYTFSIKDAEYVNSVNQGAITLKVDLDEVLTENTKFTLVFSGNDKENGTAKELTKSMTIEKNLVSKEKKDPIDLSGFADGIITLTMKDPEGNVVGQYKMEKNTVKPEATNVNTNRTGTRTATLSLEKCGKSGITTVKYIVLSKDDTKPDDTKPSEDKLTNTINASNGKVEKVQIADNLETNKVYKVYYVLENEYGSISDMKEAVIALDSRDVKAEEALKEVVAPVLSETTTAEFTWDAGASKTYIATLYKDGEAVAVQEVTEGKADFTNEMKENGTYKVSVVVKGSNQGTSTNSPATESEEVTVSTLASVTDVKIENVDNVIELSWNNPNGKEEFKEYSISLYSINDKGEEVLVADDITCENDKNKVDITSEIEVSTIYVAKVNVVALDGQMEKLSPEEVTSNQFYLVEAPIMANAVRGTESITFGINPIKIPNKTVEYKVEVYDVDTTWNDDYDRAKYTLKTTKNVTVNNENKITIDGLNSLDTYAFKLVAVVDGNEVKSAYSDEIQTLPEINNLTYAANKDEAMAENSSKVFLDGDIIYINGNEFDTSVITELQPAKVVLDNLFEGDVVSISENASNVEIILSGAADQEGSEREFTDLDESSVVLENNGYSKTISGSFKTLTLKGNVYNLADDVTADEIILTDGVDVTGNKAYTIESGATVTINGVEINASNEMKLSASGKNITVDVKGSSSNDAEFTFENTTTDDVTITFDGDETLTAQQLGTIKITSVGGKVTVLSSNVSVKADIKVEVNKGTVDISAPALTGNKEVSVTADKDNKATVVAVSKTDAPEAVINYSYYDEENMTTVTAFELKDYTDKELADMFGLDEEKDKDQIIAIDNYISSFGLNGTGATLDVEEGNVVTITLTSSVDKIENLK